MVTKIYDYLKQYKTMENIPLSHITSDADLKQIAIALYHITKEESLKNFEKVTYEIFKPLEDKAEKVLTYPIDSLAFHNAKTREEYFTLILIASYSVFQYFSTVQDLPLVKVLDEVNTFMLNSIVDKTETHTIDCTNPLSNLIPISEDKYVRFTGKQIISPTPEILKEFEDRLKKLINI